jgi:hypothetical protein
MDNEACDCDWCTVWAPLARKLQAQLPADSQEDFEALLDYLTSAARDGGTAQAKLDGVWPGWEWLPPLIAAHQVQTVTE